MVIRRLSKEEEHKRNLEQLAAYRPLDDDFMRELFRDNLPLAQYVLRVITGIDDLVLTREETQTDMKRLVGGRSICLDVFGEDSKGRKFDLEVQRADNGARPKRARYHSSAMDVEFLQKNQEFEELPITYTIFITENDVFNAGEALYPIERINTALGKPFGDDEHIIYVNGAYVGDSEIGRLMHDFRCNNADDMFCDLLAEKTRYYKENPKGVSGMCKLMEDRLIDNENQVRIQVAVDMLTDGGYSNEQVAKISKLTLSEIKEIEKQLETKAQ
ncbi:MAG: Rpn family recombination-promoting nuclease/putative transposase [Oscillospiraceae bacterium]|nr:Rpn family recombination-promoting nuclease/putative transposase [Oscillospiraceae bacterium]